MPWSTRALRYCHHSGRRGVGAELRSESPRLAGGVRGVSAHSEALAATGLGEPMGARYERVVLPARPASLDPLRGRRGTWLGASVLALCLAAGCGRKNDPEFKDEVAYFYEDQAWLHKAWAENQAGAAHLSRGAWAAAADQYARARHVGAEKFAELDAAIKERDPLLASELGLFGQQRRAVDVIVSNTLLEGYAWVAALNRVRAAGEDTSNLARRASQAFLLPELAENARTSDRPTLSSADGAAIEFLRRYYADFAEDPKSEREPRHFDDTRGLQ